MIRLIDDRIFTASADQLYELERFKEEDMPPKEEDKLRLEDIYRRLQVLAGTEHLNIPEHLSTHSLQRAWNELLHSIDRRAHVLHDRMQTQVE